MIEARHLTKRYGHTVAVDDAWGSNPRPADYEKYGLVHPSALAARMTRVIALTALTALGSSGAPVHEPVHVVQQEISHDRNPPA